MKKTGLALTAAAVASAGLFASAATAGQTFSTEVDIIDGALVGDTTYILGEVESSRRACRSDRIVKLLVRHTKDGPFDVEDTDRSSANGVFAVSFDSGVPFSQAKLRAPRKRLSPTKTCTADSTPVVF